MFRYDDAWNKGRIIKIEDDNLIIFNIDTLCDLYKAYSDFFMLGVKTEIISHEDDDKIENSVELEV